MHNAILPRLVITPGEPAGIGPDICVRAAQQPFAADLVAIADRSLLSNRARQLGIALNLSEFDPAAPRRAHRSGTLNVLHCPLRKPCAAGQLDRDNAAYVLETLRLATAGCLDGRFDGLVTGPVHKAVINDSGVAFSGHTEFLAELSATPQVVMMLAAKDLRVALVTTHVPLAQVSGLITRERVEAVLRILIADLRAKFGIASPRVLVCGLNPHAGEDGHLGREDIDVIVPVLEKLRHEGATLIGPIPADTAFIPKRLQEIDAVLAMYHDQGLPVLKFAGFGNAINITLGLPFIRTSVDHGTALELAGTPHGDPSSLIAAINAAIGMVHASRAVRG